MAVYDVFSKRGLPLPDVYQYEHLPERLRMQMVYFLRDTLQKFSVRHGEATSKTYVVIRDVLIREHGVPYLHCSHNPKYVQAEFEQCILHSPSALLILDLLEKVLQIIPWCIKEPSKEYSSAHYGGLSQDDAISQFNFRFRENGVGYQFDKNSMRLVRVDNLVQHRQVIQPVLALLTDTSYSTANNEFLAAMEHYKKANYGDAITSAGSAFESVMKIICAKKGWTHSKGAAANALIDTICDNSGLDGKFKNALLGAANVRNAVSTAHGGGTTPRTAEEHHCQLTINLAASAILFLVDEFN